MIKRDSKITRAVEYRKAHPKETLTYVRNFFGKLLQWDDFEDKYIRPHGTIYRFAVSSQCKTVDILHVLYDNSTVHLARKYELYEKYCRV